LRNNFPEIYVYEFQCGDFAEHENPNVQYTSKSFCIKKKMRNFFAY